MQAGGGPSLLLLGSGQDCSKFCQVIDIRGGEQDLILASPAVLHTRLLDCLESTHHPGEPPCSLFVQPGGQAARTASYASPLRSSYYQGRPCSHTPPSQPVSCS
jgi:hypothetical protein